MRDGSRARRVLTAHGRGTSGRPVAKIERWAGRRATAADGAKASGIANRFGRVVSFSRWSDWYAAELGDL